MLPPKRKGMLSDGEINGMKNYASAILRSALTDASRGYSPAKLEQFAESEWCRSLCDLLNVSCEAYKRELAKRISDYIDQCKPKRIQTYRLVELLKDGKDTGADKAQRIGEVLEDEPTDH